MAEEDKKETSTNPFHEMYGYRQEGYRVGEEEKRLHILYKIGFIIFGVIFPLFAFFFYIIWRHDRPKDAKWPGIGFLLGFLINFGAEVFRFVMNLIRYGHI